MSAPSVTVRIDSVNHAGWVKGWRARWLIEQCGGRPVWSPLSKSWSTSEKTAKDVLAFADLQGIDVTLLHSRRVVA